MLNATGNTLLESLLYTLLDITIPEQKRSEPSLIDSEEQSTFGVEHRNGPHKAGMRRVVRLRQQANASNLPSVRYFTLTPNSSNNLPKNAADARTAFVHNIADTVEAGR